jgi:predicted dehydrogenase
MIHDLDLLMHLVQSPVVDVSAVGLTLHGEHEDLATVTLIFENGCVGRLTASRLSGERLRTLRVVESDRTFTLDFIEQSVQQHVPRPGQASDVEDVAVSKAEPLQLELEHFIDCIRTNRCPAVSGEDGHRALELALRAVDGMKLVRAPDTVFTIY